MAHRLTLSYRVLIKVNLFDGSLEVAENFSVAISGKEDIAILSLTECRKHLKGMELSDIQVLELRDTLSALIDATLDNYFHRVIASHPEINGEK